MIRNYRRKLQKAGGFSLLELMIIMAIIGTLVAVAAPAYFNHMMRSRQSAAIGELMSIKASQERFFTENNGLYAPQINQLEGYMVAGTTYVRGDYTYWIVGNTIRALGDLNRDGVANDGWELPIDDLAAKPKPYVTGGDEGFTWSSLGHLF